MMQFSFSAPESLSGHPKASGAAPKDKVCFFGGTAKAQRSGAGPHRGWRGNRNPKGGNSPKQKTAAPPGSSTPSGRESKLCPRDKGAEWRDAGKSESIHRQEIFAGE